MALSLLYNGFLYFYNLILGLTNYNKKKKNYNNHACVNVILEYLRLHCVFGSCLMLCVSPSLTILGTQEILKKHLK